MSELRADYDELMDLFLKFKKTVRRRNPHLYERWKAGGFLIDNDVVSMYPSLEEVFYQLEPEEFED